MKTRLGYVVLILSGIVFWWFILRSDGLIPLPLRWVANLQDQLTEVELASGEEAPTPSFEESTFSEDVFKYSLRTFTCRPELPAEAPEAFFLEEETFQEESQIGETGENEEPSDVGVVRNLACLLPPPLYPPAGTWEDEAVSLVGEMPRFPGCEDDDLNSGERSICAKNKLLEFISENIRFPASARDAGISGTVVVQFVVERDGTLTDAEIVRDIGAGCGEEVLRLIHLMNEQELRWSPGNHRGRLERVRITLPVRFALR